MHTLRHTLANELLRNEIPLPVISEILGHKSLESTMQYLRADVEQLRYCTLAEGENMQPKAKTLIFKSELAPWLYTFFEEKYRLGYKYKSIDSYLMSFDRFLLDKDCKNSLSKELVLQWVERKPHQKAETVRCNIRTMRVLADFLNRNGVPAYRVPQYSEPRQTHDFIPYIFTYSEIERILAVFDGFVYNKASPKRHLVYPLLIRVLAFCGLRASEALNLRVKDVNFENGYFTLRDTKNCQDRIIPLDENLRERFDAYKGQMNFMTGDEYFSRLPMEEFTALLRLRKHSEMPCLLPVYPIAVEEKARGCTIYDILLRFIACKN